MSTAFLSKLGTSDVVDQIGAYNQYAGRGHEAAKIIQERYKNYCYRKLVPFGSGTKRDDIEQIHGFFRTLVFGPSIENRNLFALQLLRIRRLNRTTSRFDMLDQLIVYCERIPAYESDPITTRALNGAFKVKFICESLGGMPATSWDEESGRWSIEFETEETLNLLKSSLSSRDEALLNKHHWNGQRFLYDGNWSRTNPIFNQYIRALKCICRQPEYHSKEWEAILNDAAHLLT